MLAGASRSTTPISLIVSPTAELTQQQQLHQQQNAGQGGKNRNRGLTLMGLHGIAVLYFDFKMI